MRRLSPSHLAFIACVGLAAAACGGSDAGPPGSVAELCKATDAPSCTGNYVVKCAAGGKAYDLTFCGESNFCAAGACEPTKCTKGARKCDGKKVLACSDKGDSEFALEKTCGASEACTAGVCVGNACVEGDKRCGWSGDLAVLLECKQGVWSQKTCGTGQGCDPGAPACLAHVCKAGERKCSSNTEAAECALTTLAWKSIACGAGQGCYDGICHAIVTGSEPDIAVADAGVTDTTTPGTDGSATEVTKVDSGGYKETITKDVQFEPLNVLKVYMIATPNPGPGDTKLEYEFIAANYRGNDKDLQVTGDVGLQKIELHVTPIEEFQTGTFTAEGQEAPDSGIFANDGSTDQTQMQWRWQATDYTITITQFDDFGGRVKGTFSGKLKDNTGGPELYLVEGIFDIQRK